MFLGFCVILCEARCRANFVAMSEMFCYNAEKENIKEFDEYLEREKKFPNLAITSNDHINETVVSYMLFYMSRFFARCVISSVNKLTLWLHIFLTIIYITLQFSTIHIAKLAGLEIFVLVLMAYQDLLIILYTNTIIMVFSRRKWFSGIIIIPL